MSIDIPKMDISTFLPFQVPKIENAEQVVKNVRIIYFFTFPHTVRLKGSIGISSKNGFYCKTLFHACHIPLVLITKNTIFFLNIFSPSFDAII